MLVPFEHHQFWNTPCFLEADTGGSGGGAPAVLDDKKFTQADVDKFVQERLKNKKREMLVKDKEIEDLKKEVEKLKTSASTPPNTPPTPDPKTSGDIEIMQQRHDRQLKEISDRLEAAEKAREDEHNRRLKTERDKELGDALQAARCKDHTGGRRFCEPCIEWDTVEGKWLFRTKSNNLVSIVDGVVEELPDYLREPAMDKGGSGSNSTPPKRLAKKNELEVAKKKLEQLEQQAAKNRGNTALIAQCHTQRKLVRQLEAEFAS